MANRARKPGRDGHAGEHHEPMMTLEEVIAGGLAADGLTRIEWRDRIAEHGAAAIDVVSPWITDPKLSAFAVRVIEATAKFGERDAAISALMSVRRVAPDATIVGDIGAALQRLGAVPHPPNSGLPPDAGRDWPGFRESDFGLVKDTTWRRGRDRVGLIPLLLRPLRVIDPEFASFPIWMTPDVHLADRDRYVSAGDWNQGWRASKLVIYAHGPTQENADVPRRVVAGYYVEKGTGRDEYGPVDPQRWDWPRFLALLRDPARRRQLEAIVARHGMRLGDYVGGRFKKNGAIVGFTGTLEDGELVLRDSSRSVLGTGWDDLTDRLSALPEGVWHDFHVWREWPADEAIEMRQSFAFDALVPVFTDLGGTYLDVIKTIYRG
jgi:hypothetical protein